jgi:exosortase/archaeosortase family protein
MRRHRKSSLTELRKGFWFLIGIMAFYTFFWFLLANIDLWQLKVFAAGSANALLNAAGVPATLAFGAEPSIVVGGVAAQITNLCAGDLEIALLFAAILSTFDRTWRQRLWGCIFGFLLILVANPLRIFAVLYIGGSSGWQAADLAHNLLFRLTLLAIIVIYYYVWYVKYDTIGKWLKRKKGKR